MKTVSYEHIPPECLLRVIEFLTLRDITVLLRTSTLWNAIITQNENLIYHRISNSFDPIAPALGNLEAARKEWVSSAARVLKSWKEYCRLQIQTHRRWLGKTKANMSMDVLEYTQRAQVHRIKIDVEKLLLVLTEDAAPDASLVVHCLEGRGRPMLFQLNQVSNFAHVEMSNGYVMFTCEEPTLLEVWRWAQDQAMDPAPAQPELNQIDMYENAMGAAGFQLGSQARRGELVPMGVLRQPAELRATRLVYPTLCVGSRVGDRLWLWDIRTRRLTQTIYLELPLFETFGMLYVDVNETHAFVATHTVSVYSRSSGQCIFQLRDTQLERLTYCVGYPTLQQRSSSVFLEYALEAYREPFRSIHNNTVPSDIVMAVHVSPTGDDFVAVTFRGFMFHISGLKEATVEHESASSNVPSPITPSTPTGSNAGRTELVADKFKVSVTRGGTSLTHLAYDGNRIVAAGGQGLCIINLEPQPEEVFPVSAGDKQIDLYPFPARFLNRVPPFGSEKEEYGDFSAVQITQEAIWVAWQPYLFSRHEDLRSERKAVGMMMFSEEDGEGD